MQIEKDLSEHVILDSEIAKMLSEDEHVEHAKPTPAVFQGLSGAPATCLDDIASSSEKCEGEVGDAESDHDMGDNDSVDEVAEDLDPCKDERDYIINEADRLETIELANSGPVTSLKDISATYPLV